jgi:predicted TIM-barrel fold metal-dependent hydrolase
MKVLIFSKKMQKYLQASVCILLIFSLFACTRLIKKIAGASSQDPGKLHESCSKGAQKLIENAFKDINSERLVDYHTHIFGTCGSEPCDIKTCESKTDKYKTYLNPKMQSWLHPGKRIAYFIYASAAHVKNPDIAETQWVDRFVELIKGFKQHGDSKDHGKFLILAHDKYYNPEGKVNCENLPFYVSNNYIDQKADEHPDKFLPVVSIHPYREDALDELEKWANKEVKYVKWLPNTMGIDPSDPRVDRFYEKMYDKKMILITHVGEEEAVEARNQSFGNPLLFRRALDKGVRVIMAHCASLGKCRDFDSKNKKMVSCFDLFMRLMNTKEYEGCLFGDISAILQYNRMPVALSTILERQDLHHRLVNGSDYPIPAINVLYPTRYYVYKGFITSEQRESLNEIYDYNPLLFDFVLKRTVRHPDKVEKLQFAPSVFMVNPGLEKSTCTPKN